MKKQKLIQLHGLLGIIAQNTDVSSEDLDDYSEVSVSPSAIHKSKDTHKEGVFALANDLVNELENTEQEQGQEKIEV